MAKDAASGFTLIELIVLVAIIAIIATVGIPSFNNLLRDATIRSDGNALVGTINLARSEAIRRSALVWIAPTNDSDWQAGWDIRVDDGDRSLDADKDELLRHFNAIDSTILSSPTRLSIAANGSLASPTSSVEFHISPEGCQNDEQRRLRVEVSGRASLSRMACSD